MLDARDLVDLVAVHKAGSLSQAAKSQGVAISTLSRRLEALEASTGLRLIDRRADGSRLTVHGVQIAEAAEPLSNQVARVHRTVEILREGGLQLPVRITATEFVIAEVLAPRLPDLWKLGAKFPVHLQSQFDMLSLAGRDADVAIRMSRPQGASLIAVKLPEVQMGLYASCAYLAGRDPRKLELRAEKLIAYEESSATLPETGWITQHGLNRAVLMRIPSMHAQMRAVIAGAGIGLLPRAFAGREADLVQLPTPSGLQTRTP
jgi:DNA-binding transcriptional LysR family regulator